MTRTVSRSRLDTLFRPTRIAVIGAADKSYFSRALVDNLVRAGIGDRVHLVNLRSRSVHGRAALASAAAIGEPVDLAFVMVPQHAVLDALSDAADAGIGAAAVLTSGYAESGPDGRAAQQCLVDHATRLGIVLLGPNCLGFANLVDGIPATAIPGVPDEAGGVALLSQSGASAGAMIEFARTCGVGLSHLVTLGNEAMLTAGHVLDYVVDDERTSAVAMFLETVRQPDVFRAAANTAREAGKPIVVLKAGRSALAARSAAAHTGALVGSDVAVDAVFAELGVIRVATIEELLTTAGLAADLGRLERGGAGVVSISGGACGIAADLSAAAGLELPGLAPRTVESLADVLPAYATAQNPLDVTGAAVLDPAVLAGAIAAVGADPSVGVVLAVNKLPWRVEDEPFAGQPFVDAVGKGAGASSAPVVFVNQVSQPITPVTRTALRHAGVSYAVCGLGTAVTAIAHLARWSTYTDPRRVPTPCAGLSLAELPTGRRAGHWSEVAARDLLAAAGVPLVPAVLCATADEAVGAAAHFGGPVAVKVVSAQILHKSDIGGVELSVAGAAEVRAAFADVVTAARAVPDATVDGVLVAPMRSGGVDLLVGVLRDPDWGPLLTVALGGVFVEVLGDVAVAPVPTSPARIRELLSSLRAYPLLTGLRGARPADIDTLVETISRIAGLADVLGEELEALEVNPLHVTDRGVEALDAVVTWRDRTTDGGE